MYIFIYVLENIDFWSIYVENIICMREKLYIDLQLKLQYKVYFNWCIWCEMVFMILCEFLTFHAKWTRYLRWETRSIVT